MKVIVIGYASRVVVCDKNPEVQECFYCGEEMKPQELKVYSFEGEKGETFKFERHIHNESDVKHMRCRP